MGKPGTTSLPSAKSKHAITSAWLISSPKAANVSAAGTTSLAAVDLRLRLWPGERGEVGEDIGRLLFWSIGVAWVWETAEQRSGVIRTRSSSTTALERAAALVRSADDWNNLRVRTDRPAQGERADRAIARCVARVSRIGPDRPHRVSITHTAPINKQSNQQCCS
jgi:hypothetical protein